MAFPLGSNTSALLAQSSGTPPSNIRHQSPSPPTYYEWPLNSMSSLTGTFYILENDQVKGPPIPGVLHRHVQSNAENQVTHSQTEFTLVVFDGPRMRLNGSRGQSLSMKELGVCLTLGKPKGPIIITQMVRQPEMQQAGGAAPTSGSPQRFVRALPTLLLKPIEHFKIEKQRWGLLIRPSGSPSIYELPSVGSSAPLPMFYSIFGNMMRETFDLTGTSSDRITPEWGMILAWPEIVNGVALRENYLYRVKDAETIFIRGTRCRSGDKSGRTDKTTLLGSLHLPDGTFISVTTWRPLGTNDADLLAQFHEKMKQESSSYWTDYIDCINNLKLAWQADRVSFVQHFVDLRNGQ
jgi:hypothetical protein